MEDCTEDQNIRKGNEKAITGTNDRGYTEAVTLSSSCVCTRQLHHSHELTVGVSNDWSPAVGQLLEQDGMWGKEGYTSEYHCSTHFDNATVGEYRGMAQWVTDGHITVNSHGQEETRFHGSKAVDEEHLSQASIKGNVMGSKPEETEHAWQCR
jgi:hypothetical protein